MINGHPDAERLFAERGVDAVSLREVSAAAQQKNGLITTHLEPTRTMLGRDVDHPTD